MKLGIWFSSSKTKFQFYKLDLVNAWLLLTQTEGEGLLPVNPSSSFFFLKACILVLVLKIRPDISFILTNSNRYRQFLVLTH
jgi:hypothetical protein